MLRFFTFFILTYSLFHALFYFRLRPLIPAGRLAHTLVIIFMALMIFMPLASALLDQAGCFTLGRWLAWTGYLWMGLVLLGFIIGVATLLIEVVLFIVGRVIPVFSAMNGPKIMSGFTLGLALLMVIYGVFEAKYLRVERLTMITDKLPATVKSLKIVQISDLHLSVMTQDSWVREVIEAIRSEKPDLLVATGDVVDSRGLFQPDFTDLFNSLKPPWGKFAIPGNHEVYAGLARSTAILESYGFVMLRNQPVSPGGVLNLVGVDDPQTRVEVNEPLLLKSVQNGLYIILLKHRPDVDAGSLGLFDLQISGHTHGGQIFPFNFITRTVYPYLKGFFRLASGSSLYTSRGTGTWGPPMRILSPPEVTVIELVRQDRTESR